MPEIETAATYNIRRGGVVKRPPNGPTVAWTPIEPVADEWDTTRDLAGGYRCLGVIGNSAHLHRSGGHTPWCSETYGGRTCVPGKVYAIDLLAPDMPGLESWLVGRLREGQYEWVSYLNINNHQYSRRDAFRSIRHSDDEHLHLSGRPGYEKANSSILRDWAAHRAARTSRSETAAPFVAEGHRWAGHRLTYQFLNYGARGLTSEQIRAAIRGALDEWERVTPFRFTESTNGDIRIGFFAGDHHDGPKNKFDGPNHVLAHCFFPPAPGSADPIAGDLHFDAAEQWTVDGSGLPGTGRYDLQTVALHELGHGLGLDHSQDRSAVMWAYYSGIRRTLTADDVAGVRWIYRDAA